MEQRLRDVIIERLLPRFKMNNMVWFRHDFPIESKLEPIQEDVESDESVVILCWVLD